MKRMRRPLAMLLALVMVLGMVPVNALAADSVTSPFENGDTTNPHYRIPAIVTMSDGALVAAADRRNQAYYSSADDCRDIDTLVAISQDGGVSWTTTTAHDTQYGLGSNVHYSGTFIDPAIATDGTTVYLLADLFPGQSSTRNCSVAAEAGTGYDDSGYLKLSSTADRASYDYYLNEAEGKIYDYSTKTDQGYTVDSEYFLYKDGTKLGNLFNYSTESGSVTGYFWPQMTSYLYLSIGTYSNGAITWTSHKNLNHGIKQSDERYCVDGPGAAMVTSKNHVVFPVYSGTTSDSTERVSLIFSTDSGDTWKRTDKLTTHAASEGELVELKDGTLRYFFRHYSYTSSHTLRYVDATWDADTGTYTWGQVVNTGISCNSCTDLGAISYSGTFCGKQVILVSAPSGTSSPYDRVAGNIYTFTVGDGNALTLENTYNFNTGAFGYSCMTELENGTIGLLYENGDSGGISFATLDAETVTGMTFGAHIADANDELVQNEIYMQTGAGSTYTIWNMAANETATASSSNTSVVTAAVSGSTLTLTAGSAGTAKVTVQITETAAAATSGVAAIASADTGTTFEIDVTVGATANEENLTLSLGQVKTITVNEAITAGTHTSDAADVAWVTPPAAQYLAAQEGTDSSFTGDVIALEQCLYTFTQNTDDSTWVIRSADGDPDVYVDPYWVSGTQKTGGYPNRSAATNVTITASGYTGTTDGPFILADNTDGGSLHFHTQTGTYYWNQCAGAHSEDSNGTHGIFILSITDTGVEEVTALADLTSGESYLIAGKGVDGNYYLMHPATSTSAKYAHVAKYLGMYTESTETTTITITAKAAGSTSIAIGDTTYNITVSDATTKTETVTLNAGDTATYRLDVAVAAGTHSSDAADVTWTPGTEYTATQGTSNGFDGSVVRLSDCLYTFTYKAENQYSISATTAEGGTVYVDPHGTKGNPNAGTEETVVTVQAGLNNYQIKLYQGTSTSTGSLHFHAEENNPYWNWCTDDPTGNCNVLMLYRPVKDGEDSSTEIPGYIKIEGQTGLADEVGTGSGEYLIVGANSAGNYYVMYPTAATGSSRTQMAKVNGADAAADLTTVTVTAKAAGNTTVSIGDTTYNITVNTLLTQVDVPLYVGQSAEFTDDTGNYQDTVTTPANLTDANGTVVATMDVVGDTAITNTAVSTEKASDLEAGATYIMRVYDTTYALSANVTTHTAWGANNRAFEINNLTAEEAHLWTLEAADGGYKLKNTAGYLNLGSNNNTSYLDTTGEVFTLTYTDIGWTVCNPNSKYINALGGTVASAAVGGWTGDGTRFDLYKVTFTYGEATTVTFTGKAVGDTVAIVGNTQYNITVEQRVEDITLFVGERKDATIEDFALVDGSDTYDSIVSAQWDGVATAAQLGTDSSFTGDKISLDDCLYTFTNNGSNWTVSADVGGTPVYVYPSSDSATQPNQTTLANVTIASVTSSDTNDGPFTISGNGSLHFHSQGTANLYKWNRCSGAHAQQSNGTHYIFILQRTVNGMEALTSLDQLKSGNQYFIAGKGTDGNYYLMHPSTGTNDYNHVAKYIGGTDEAAYETTVTFTGVAAGETTATIGYTQYNITVSYWERLLDVYSGTPLTVTASGTVTADQVSAFNADNTVVTVAWDETAGTLTFTSKEKGTVEGVLGDTQYTVHSHREEVDLTLYQGVSTTLTIDGMAYTAATTEPASTTATLDKVEGTTIPGAKHLVAVTADNPIVSGKSYLITTKNNKSVLTAEAYNDAGTQLTIGNVATGDSTDLWTFTASGDGYTISTAEGKFLDLSNGAAVSDTSQVMTVAWVSGETTCTIAPAGTTTYLNNHGNSNTYATTWTTADDGNKWYLYEIVSDPDEYETTVTFTGVAAGETTATVGHVTYNITVETEAVRDITLYVGIVTTDVIVGTKYVNNDSVQPDNTYAYIHSVTPAGNDTEVVFSGITEGTTTAKVGHVTYNITVKSLGGGEDIAGFNAVIGVDTYTADGSTVNMAGQEIKSLRITERSTFQVSVDVADYDSLSWESVNESVATVAADGTITAVAEGETLVTATVTKDGATETISIRVKVVPALVEEGEDSAVIFYYMDNIHYVDTYYTMFLSSVNPTGAVAGHEMVMVCEGEAIYYERPAADVVGFVWTSDPWDGYALTYMASTGSKGDYFPLKDSTGALGDDLVDPDNDSTTDNSIQYYKGSDGYDYILSYGSSAGASWQTALDAMLQTSVDVGKGYWNDPGCDGAMSNSRRLNDGNPNIVSSVSFIAERLPEVDKSVYGVLGTSGKQADWKLYQEGMYATVGEYVYFAITVTQDAPHSWQYSDNNGTIATDTKGKLAALYYENTANLTDRLMMPVTDAAGNVTYEPNTLKVNPPYFYTKEKDMEDNKWDGYLAAADQTNTQNILADLNEGWTEEEITAGQRVHEYYVVYQIQEEDNNTMLVNGAGLNYQYTSAYSAGSSTATVEADANMYILGAALGNYTLDFGLPLVIADLTKDNLAHQFDQTNTNNAIGGARYGEVTITQTAQDDDSTTDVDEARWTVTYTPNRIMQGYDVVYLMNENNQLVNYFRVYPATTVYYEENLLKPAPTEPETTVPGDEEAQSGELAWSQKGTPSAEAQKLEHLGEGLNPYGYDAVYADDLLGSSGSYLSASAVGTATTFTFTGTGFDLYANCDAESGYVAVTVWEVNDDGSKPVQGLYMVNTKVKSGFTPDTASQTGNEYHMPILSLTDLTHGTYEVEIRKVLNPSREVRIDGVRIYNTVEDSSIFVEDLEDNPQFYDLRDYVLKAVNVTATTGDASLKDVTDQVYGAITDTDAEQPNVSSAVILGNRKAEKSIIITETTTTKYKDGEICVQVVTTTQDYMYTANGTDTEVKETVKTTVTWYDADKNVIAKEDGYENGSGIASEDEKTQTKEVTYGEDLLNHSPKNELFLYPGQTLAFNVTTSRKMQLGLKAPNGSATTYKLTCKPADGEAVTTAGTMNTSVDMFYKLNDPASANIANQATITATGDNESTSDGSTNLVDGSTSTLYKFYNGAMSDEQSVILTYTQARRMSAMAIAFENVGETDSDGYSFTYSILARNGSGEYDTIVANAAANRTDNSSQQYSFPKKEYTEVKIVMHSCTAVSGDSTTAGWPAIAEFEVYSRVENTYTITVENTGDSSILSVTKLKICDDPDAVFAPLTKQDIATVLMAAGYTDGEDEQQPETTEPETTEPETTEPETTEPETTEPETTEPEATQPEATQPAIDPDCTGGSDCPLKGFTDTDSKAWYHDGVHFCLEEGVMNGMGDGTFAPDASTTRAQLVMMLYRMAGEPKANGATEPFADVAEDAWYYDAIVWAYGNQVVNGVSATQFAPDANVTREQMATILHRFLVTPAGTGKLDSFSDGAKVSAYAREALSWAVGEQLINGVAQTDGTVLLDPAGTATRAQIATILMRYLTK